MEAHASVVEKPFSNSEAAFYALIETLESPDMAALTHGVVERRLETQGRELLRIMFEDHLNLRVQAVPTAPVVGSDGETRTHRRAMACTLGSLFGPARLSEREGFRGPGLETLCPIDAELNLPKTMASHGVCRRVAEYASMMSFDMVGEQLRTKTGATVGKRQLEEIAKYVSRDFDAFYESAAAKPVDADASLLVGSADGTGVCMRTEALREASRLGPAKIEDDQAKAAGAQEHLGGPALAVGAAAGGLGALGYVDDDQRVEVDAGGGEIGGEQIAALELDPHGGLALALGVGEDQRGGGRLGRAAQLDGR